MSTTTVNGVTFVGASLPVKFSDMLSAFGTRSLSAMRGKKWYKSNFTRGYFASSGAFSLSNILNTGGNIPHVDRTAWPANGKGYYSNQTIYLPAGFNTLLVQVYGAPGGGGGGNSAYSGGIYNGVTIVGGAGGAGGDVSFGSYVSATGGGGGNNGGNGANGANSLGVYGYPGGSGNGTGGYGGAASRSWSADSDTSLFGAAVTGTVGQAGGGGSGALGLSWNGYGYVFNGVNGANGNPGTGPGQIVVFVDYGLY